MDITTKDSVFADLSVGDEFYHDDDPEPRGFYMKLNGSQAISLNDGGLKGQPRVFADNHRATKVTLKVTALV
jgi:hypothetical protein